MRPAPAAVARAGDSRRGQGEADEQDFARLLPPQRGQAPYVPRDILRPGTHARNASRPGDRTGREPVRVQTDDVRRLLPPPARDLTATDLADLYAAAPGRYVRGGMVLSADGGVTHDGRSAPLTSAADRAALRTLRAVADVVLVGAGTARHEGYGPLPVPEKLRAWRRDHGRSERPVLAVVSAGLDLPPGLRLFQGGHRPLVVTCAAAPAGRRADLAARADLLAAGVEQVDLPAALDALAARGLGRVLCEGGPRLLGALLAADRLDELCMTLAPTLVGAAPGMVATLLARPVPLQLLHLLEQDGALLLRWSLLGGGRPPGQ